jgi:sulfhydrogenase subunit delta
MSGVPRLAVFKFASCDGCQLSLLDCEDELLAVAEHVQIAKFTEMTRAEIAGPYDVALVEGSITTRDDAERIVAIRANSRTLITIGACATAGGIQALRNYADVGDFISAIYAHPEFISTLSRSQPISALVPVDFELHGCPIDRHELIEVISAHLAHRKPRIASYSVCEQCKAKGNLCVLVAKGTPCLGPVTRTGCGALCPSVDRGCYGCFGPAESPNTVSLSRRLSELGMDDAHLVRFYRTFNAAAPAFDEEARRHVR